MKEDKKVNVLIALALLMLSHFYCRCYAMEFSGTRALGMGQAFTAVNGDISSVRHNPAGLSGIKVPEIGLDVGSFYENGHLGSQTGMLFVWPWAFLDNKRMAIHWNNRLLGEENIQQSGCSISGNTFYKDYPVRLGGTLKWRLDSLNKKQMLLIDLGVQTDLVPDKISAGMALTNLFSKYSQVAETSQSWGVLYNSPYGDLNGDFAWHDDRFYLSLGWERMLYQGLIITRLGLLSAPKKYVTFGLSTHLWPIGFDVSYAWPTNTTNESGYFQIGARYRFGGKHFSEVFLDRSIEKAVALEHKIDDLKKERTKLSKEIIELERHKIKQDADIFSLPGVPEEYRKQYFKRIEELEKEKEKYKYSKPVKEKATKKVIKITWPQHHKVVPGDTLRSIAQRYYNNPNNWQLIYNANKDKIERGQPRLGEELTIPRP
ncbi:MAG: LysM peptidoglycan-binding domain-containing protein [Endomicrobiales bacterium]|nr:LysM peptidoglycan-binding domain-containing protein [Endomicrobiales bacterium]